MFVECQNYQTQIGSNALHVKMVPLQYLCQSQGGSDKVEMSHDIPRKHARGIRYLTHAVLTPHIHSDSSVEVLLLFSLLATATIHGMLQYMLTRFH